MDDGNGEPRSLGELFSDATALMRRHLAPVVAMSLPFVATELMLREAASTFLLVVRRGLAPDAEDPAGLVAVVAEPLLVAIALFVASRVVVQGATVAATVFTAHALTGDVLEPNRAVRTAIRFMPRVLVAELAFYALFFVVAVLPAVACIVVPFVLERPALLLALAPVAVVWFVVAAIALYLRLVLAPQAIVLEGRGAIASLTRSTTLMRAHGEVASERPKFRLSILLLVYWALSSSIQSTFLVPVLIIGVLQGMPLSELPPPLTEIPLVASIPLAVLQVIGNAVVLPLAGLLPTLFFRDLLARRDDEDPARRHAPSAAAP